MANDWHYAVVVGIDQYPEMDEGTLDLKCPEKDAISVANWLKDLNGGALPLPQVKLITRTFPDPGARQPSVPVVDEINNAIRHTVKKFRADLVKEGAPAAQKAAWLKSRFYFYISGHGIDSTGDDTVVIAANASRDYLGAHISTKGLLNVLKKDSVFAELVVIADACREFAYSAIAPSPFDFSWPGFRVDTGSKVFYACSSRTHKRSYEPPDDSGIVNSFFTYSLLQALKTSLVGREVTSQSIKNFVYNHVPELTEKHLNIRQVPEINDPDPIVFVPFAPQKARVTLTVVPGSAFQGVAGLDAVVYAFGKVQFRQPFDNIGTGQYQADLSSGTYLILPLGAEPAGGLPMHSIIVFGDPLDESLP